MRSCRFIRRRSEEDREPRTREKERYPSRQSQDGVLVSFGEILLEVELPPNCRTRGSHVLVACPKVLEPNLLPMPLNAVWLKVLNDSARNSKLTLS